jgi:ABC-type antimicrobial peptide transport system permease subunit
MVATFFAVLGIVFTIAGLYGVTADSVSQRRFEIGVRIAMGASDADVLQAVLTRVGALVVTGIGIGLIGSTWAGEFVESMLYGVRPQELSTFAIACGVLIASALLAAYIPARRAARVDPLVALRYE